MQLKSRLIMGTILVFLVLCFLLILAQSLFKHKDAERFILINTQVFQSAYIGIMPLYGPIHSSSSRIKHMINADLVIDQLNKLKSDPNLKALILRINSPGGAVGSSQEIYHALLNFKKETEIPVIVSFSDIGASGAYYLAMAADTIFANEGSLIGSIGVILQHYDIVGLAEKIGVQAHTYKSGPHKDILSMWRKPELGDQKIIDDMIRDIHSQFVAALMKSRSLSKAEAKKLSDGRIFSGRKALEVRLIDRLGGLDAATRYAQEITHISRPARIIKTQKPSFFELFEEFERRISLQNIFGLNFLMPRVQ